MQVGTYPTRSFAQCCYYQDKAVSHQLIAVSQTDSIWRIGHFCQPLHVAMQLGLYLHPRWIHILRRGARRIVSEDTESAMCSLRRIDHLAMRDLSPAAIADLVFPADCLHQRIFTASLDRERLRANDFD